LFLTIADTTRGDSPFAPRGRLELPNRLLSPTMCGPWRKMGIGRN